MSMADFEQHRQRLAQSPDQPFLGRLIYFEVNETNVLHADLESQLTAAGLERFVPGKPCDADVFRRAFTNGQRKRLTTPDPDVFEHLLVRMIAQSDGKIIKRIVVERVDQAGLKLGYTEAVEVIFDREHPESVSVTSLGTWHPAALQLAYKLAGEYRQTRGFVNSDAIRNMVKRVLEVGMATMLRPGLYFVMEDKVAPSLAMEELANRLPGAMVHSLPLVDDEKQRTNVRRAFEAESIESIDRLVAEIVEITRGDNDISFARYESFQRQYSAITAKTKEYGTLLAEQMSTTQFRLQVFQAEMGQLYRKIKR